MTPELRKELAAEYGMLQTQYEAFDGRALVIKGWGTALLAGGLGVGLKESSPALLAATIVAALCLWLLEAIWKVFQYAYIDRLNYLEDLFRRDPDEAVAPFQIFTAWTERFRRCYRGRPGAFARIMAYPFVFLPYLPIVVASLIGIAVVRPVG